MKTDGPQPFMKVKNTIFVAKVAPTFSMKTLHDILKKLRIWWCVRHVWLKNQFNGLFERKLLVGKYSFADVLIVLRYLKKIRINTLNVYKVRSPMMAYLVKPGVVHQISLVSIMSYD